MSKVLFPAEELSAFLHGPLMTRWHRIALESGFRDSAPPPPLEDSQAFLNQAGIQGIKELLALLEGLHEAKGSYFLRKIRAYSQTSNFEAAPAYLLRHFLYLLLPDREDLLDPSVLGVNFVAALDLARQDTLKREYQHGAAGIVFETLRLDRLKLINYRGFESYEIDTLGPRLTLLIGDNGSGKTALLESIKTLVGEFLYEPSTAKLLFQQTAHMLSRKRDLHQKTYVLGQNATRETAERLELSLNGWANDQPCHWQTELDASGLQINSGQNSAFALWREQVENGIPVCLPMVAYYGAGRLWQEVMSSPDIDEPTSRLSGYSDCLDPRSHLQGLMRWFYQNELAALQKRETRHVLENVRQAIVSMIPDAINARWDMDFNEFHILFERNEKQESMPFHHLSDGFRNLVGMAGDIAWRMAQLNPQLEAEAVRLTPGIVLIDELDLHLHPNWQRIVVDRLMSTFPKVQFIATTHSPFIIQSLYGKGDDVTLWDVGKQKALPLDVKSIEDIAEDKQGVYMPQQSQRYLDMMKTAERYYAALEKYEHAEEPEVAALKQELDELMIPFSDNPALHAFLKMQRLASESKREKVRNKKAKVK